MQLSGYRFRIYLDPGEGGGGGSEIPSAAPPSVDAGSSGDWKDDGNSLLGSEPQYNLDGEDKFLKDLKDGAPKDGEQNKKDGEQNKVDGAKQPVGGAPPISAPPAAAGSAPSFSDGHYQWGDKFGLTKEQVNSFGTPQAFEGWLQRTVSAQQQAVQQVARQLVEQQMKAQQATATLAPSPAAPPAGGYQPFALPALAPGDEYDPGIVAMTKHFNDQMASMHAQLSGVMPQFQTLGQMQQQFQVWQDTQRQAAQQNLNTQVDGLLGQSDENLYGKGDWSQITPAQRNSRVQVSQALARLEAGYLGRGEALPPLQQIVDAAHRLTFADHIRSQVLSEAATKSQRLRGQAVAVPGTQRRAEAVSPDEAAARAIAEKMRDFDRAG